MNFTDQRKGSLLVIEKHFTNSSNHRKSRCSIAGGRDLENWVNLKQWQCHGWEKERIFYACVDPFLAFVGTYHISRLAFACPYMRHICYIL